MWVNGVTSAVRGDAESQSATSTNASNTWPATDRIDAEQRRSDPLLPDPTETPGLLNQHGRRRSQPLIAAAKRGRDSPAHLDNAC